MSIFRPSSTMSQSTSFTVSSLSTCNKLNLPSTLFRGNEARSTRHKKKTGRRDWSDLTDCREAERAKMGQFRKKRSIVKFLGSNWSNPTHKKARNQGYVQASKYWKCLKDWLLHWWTIFSGVPFRDQIPCANELKEGPRDCGPASSSRWKPQQEATKGTSTTSLDTNTNNTNSGYRSRNARVSFPKSQL